MTPDEASVMLDSVLEGRSDFVDRIEEVLSRALSAYKQQFPRSKAFKLYAFVARSKQDQWRSRGRGDVFCRVCGELIIANVRYANHRGIPSVLRHQTVCALMMLAGMRAAVEPHTRKLPWDALDPANSSANSSR